MTDRTKIRIREIRRRTRQRQNRALSHLTALSLLLLAGIGVLLQRVQSGGVSAVMDGYGSVLLREGAGSYIIVGLSAFAAGVALTVLCIRCRKNASDRMEDAEETEENS